MKVLIRKFLNKPLDILDGLVPKDSMTFVFSGNNLKGINGNIASVIKKWPNQSNRLGYKGYVLSLKGEKFKGLTNINPISIKGVLVLLKSGTIVFSHGPEDVLWKALCNSKRRRVINLWHGVPLKRIGPWTTWKNQTLIAASETERKLLSELTKVELKNIVVTGYPRTDSLIKDREGLRETALKTLKVRDKGQKYILYTPTYRNQKKSSGYIHRLPDFSAKELINLLETQDSYLIVRPHINEPLSDFKRNDRVLFAGFDLFPDVEPLYALADVLITDYSSSIFDYSLLDRPMIGASADLVEYKKNPGLVFDYEDIFPGPTIKKWVELRKELEKALEGQDEYKKKRKEFSNRFNKFKDGNSTKRVLDIICDI